MEQCPECGAIACEQRFHEFLALEYTDPHYGAVHHLTVPAYMLQHPSRLSREGWRAMRDTLKQFLEHQRSPSEVRAANRQRVSSANRSWSLTKGPRLQLPVGFSWSQTILAVDDTTAAQYCEEIEQWARGVLAGAEML